MQEYKEELVTDELIGKRQNIVLEVKMSIRQAADMIQFVSVSMIKSWKMRGSMHSIIMKGSSKNALQSPAYLGKWQVENECNSNYSVERFVVIILSKKNYYIPPNCSFYELLFLDLCTPSPNYS